MNKAALSGCEAVVQYHIPLECPQLHIVTKYAVPVTGLRGLRVSTTDTETLLPQEGILNIMT